MDILGRYITVPAAAIAIAAVGPASAGAQTSDRITREGVVPVSTVATFEQYRPGARAVTYNRRLVPVGAGVRITSSSKGGKTVTRLAVQGLVPDRAYGAHVHMEPCGPNPADSGSHYQNVPDPVQPSVDPKYANPHNEIWLDFTTNAQGDGSSVSTVPWGFTDRHPKSVVLHISGTQHGPGQAGEAGKRIGCVNVDF